MGTGKLTQSQDTWMSNLHSGKIKFVVAEEQKNGSVAGVK